MEDLQLARNNLHAALSQALAQASGHAGRWQLEDQQNAQLIIDAIDHYIDVKLKGE